jgi:hypothetical protein
LGECLLWAVFGKLIEWPNFSATFFHGYAFILTIHKCVGLHFGLFFQELIWSPCPLGPRNSF